MKKIVLILLFLLPVSALVMVSLARYYDEKDFRRQLDEAADREEELRTEIDNLENDLLFKGGELARRESQVMHSRSRSQILEGYIEARADNPQIKIAYITIDDGPSTLSGELLDVLIQKNVPATFFVVGSENPALTKYYKRIVEDNHVLANHSYHHDYSNIYSSKDEFWKDVELQNVFLANFTDKPITLFRFPGGSENPQPLKYGGGPAMMAELESELGEKGYIYHDWNVFPDDVSAKSKPVSELVQRVKEQVYYRKNVTILLHDHPWNLTTPEALGQMIDFLRADGYIILPLSENSVPIRF
ncbi:MAG: polysaccharide deacetylase [Spirochaetales bacterium]|nr:polysaccharide deacetylase [Spirochaetales bacterium]